MPKIKLTKGELKKQRDALKQYKRYLPTLQLKKQQLQMEILHQSNIIEEKKRNEAVKISAAESWLGLLSEPHTDVRPWILPQETVCGTKNIAGVDLPVFESIVFVPAEYDLFLTPLWADHAIEALKVIISLREEIKVIEKGIAILKHELRIITQRVNLFEKVKIPETEDTIRLIKIYIGDQMANAVGCSKIAKKKIEASIFEEVGV